MKTQERGFYRSVLKVLTNISANSAKLIERGAKAQADKTPSAYQGFLTRLFESNLLRIAEASAKLILEELTGEKDFSGSLEVKFISLFEIARNAIKAWVNTYAAAKVRQILDNTRDLIRKAIARGDELNEPPRVLARRIKSETGGIIARRRALTIARTETGIAASVGADAAADATGLHLDKVWFATADERTRADHAQAHNQRVPMNGLFVVGKSRLRYPRDPNGPPEQIINCRCMVLYEPKLPA
jgi:uncharacterized protein with gpF-like domain